MPTGSGAYIVHKTIERHLGNYEVVDFNPYWTLLPITLPFVASVGKASLVHTTPDYGFFFRRKKTPLILTFHSYVIDRDTRPFGSIAQQFHHATDLRFFTKLSMREATRVTAVSRFMAWMVRKDLGYTGHIDLIYNGIDAQLFRPNQVHRIPSTEIRVLFSGNPTKRKGANLLPLIADKLSKNICIYYTSGLRSGRPLPDHAACKCIGSVAYKDMPDLYRKMDILIMPTVREGFGLAVTEAMACGLPVVASNCSSIPELVDEGSGGFLCAVGDTVDFAKKINRLADSLLLRQEMGEYNRAKIEKYFTLDRMVQQYKDLFEKSLDRNNL